MILSFDSELYDHPKEIKINLKTHQLAMLKRVIDIETNNKNSINFGIMSDRPGAGKTYVVLALINEMKKINIIQKKKHKTNIIVVPQNIYTQWIISIENFSNELSYKKFIEYENIMMLYNDLNILNENDIIITTSYYYHLISTTLKSLNINVGRIFFDEIDSISNTIVSNLDSSFTWFISASFDKTRVGIFTNKLENIDLNNITCKCSDEFIDANILLDIPTKNYYLCKNIYIDNILSNVISKKEILGLNAMDYTLYNKNFDNVKANNEKDVIELILKNRKIIIEFDNKQLEETKILLTFYENAQLQKVDNENMLKEKIETLHFINEYKSKIVSFLSNFDNYTLLYIENINIEDKDELNLIKECRKDDISLLRQLMENTLEMIYKISDIKNICTSYLKIKKIFMLLNEINNVLKTLKIICNNINEIIIKLKLNNDKAINFNNNIEIFYKDHQEFIENISTFILVLKNFEDSQQSDEKINIFSKNIDILRRNIDNNNNKIKLIYERLIDNKCCPICYEEYINTNSDKIYITSGCCNNKICGKCIDDFYDIMKKNNCIFCNSSNIIKESLFSYDIDVSIQNDINTNINCINNDLIKKDNIVFKKSIYNKNLFLKDYIDSIKNIDKKIIIFSDFPYIFQYIMELCNENNIDYVDLDKGNIKDIDFAVNSYKYGNAKILLSDSTLFGCGMNFENSTDILFVHKMNKEMESQVIGRAQRIGRKSVLNIIYLEYENESEYVVNKEYYIPFNKDDENDYNKENELEGFYENKKYSFIMDNISELDFSNISGNDIDEQSSIIPSVPIDVNLDELISTLF
jgi:hypothetical protein